MELRELSFIFNTAEFEYGVEMIVVGKKYQQIKDMLELYDYDLKKTIPMLINMVNIWINNIPTK